MLRVATSLVALHFLVTLCLPTLVLLHFQVDRARIERELCVQRDLMEGMRTCHGECQLSKRFKALEEESEKEFPAERLRARYEPMVILSAAPKPWFRGAFDIAVVRADDPVSEGFSRTVEQVPRG